MSWRAAAKEAALEVFTIILVVAAFVLIAAIAVAPMVFVFHLFGTTTGVIILVVSTLLTLFFFTLWANHKDPRK